MVGGYEKISGPALKAVMDDDIKFYPGKFKNLYRHWMENIKDWCISRQLWWGHRIPAWYAPDGSFAVAATKEEALKIFDGNGMESKKQIHNSPFTLNISQDDDCLDTWFSSWLWPLKYLKVTVIPEMQK
jgi:valyl-tRNA synthetase